MFGPLTAPAPARLNIAVLLVSGRRPMINLLAFWLGSMAAGIGFGLVALTLLRDSSPAFVHDVSSLLSGITGGHVKIVIGVLTLLVTAVTAVRLARQREQAPLGSGALPALVPQPATPTAIHRLVARVRRLLEGGNPWVSFVAGLNRATPWVEYLMALSVIVVSGAALGTHFGAIQAFIVVISALVEFPLVCYLVKPKQTQTTVLSVHRWMRAHRRGILAVGAGVLGLVMVTSGIGAI